MKRFVLFLFAALAVTAPLVAQAWGRDTVQAANYTDRYLEVKVHNHKGVTIATFCVYPKGFHQVTVSDSVLAVTLSVQKEMRCSSGNYYEKTIGFKQPSAQEPQTRAYEVRLSAAGHFEFSGGGY